MSRRPKTPLCECGRPAAGDHYGVKMCPICLARQYNVSQDAVAPSPKIDAPMPIPTADPDAWAKTVTASANDLASIFGIHSRPAIRDYELSLALGAELDRENADRQAQDRAERDRAEAQYHSNRADWIQNGGKL